jgi:D-alanyl-D-alanine carboxypeptidase
MTGRPYDQSALQADVDAILASGAVGVLALVQTEDGSVSARGGRADLDTGEPMPWNAYYRIGDDTRPFTAVVALQLVAEGRLRLTDTVERWLPGLVGQNGNDGRRITVANLLRQTSGLHEFDKRLPMAEDISPKGYRKERFHAFSPAELVALAQWQPPRWLPDSADERRWAPVSTNYILAGMVIEAVTGTSWEQEIHERVIEPLRLRHTFTPGSCAYVPQPTATAYTGFPGYDELTDTSIIVPTWADRGVISTADDLCRFYRALLSGRLLGPEQLASMRQTVPAPDWPGRPDARYGLGLAWRPADGCPDGIWFHGGTMPGSVSEGGVTADGRRAVATFTNTYRFFEQQLGQDKATAHLVGNALRTG